MSTLIRYLFAIMALILLQESLVAQSTIKDCEDHSFHALADSIHHLNISFEPNSALQLADSLLEQHKNLICPIIIKIKASRGYSYEHLYKYETAIKIYNAISKIAQVNKFYVQEIDINIALARVYEILGRPNVCKEYLDKTEQLLEQHENKNLRSHYYVRMASYYRIFGAKELAIEYAHKAIKMGEESGRLGSLAGGNLILGFLTENFEQSIEYLQKSSQYCREEGDYMGYLFQDMNIARKYLKKGYHIKALGLLNEMNAEIESLSKNKKNYYQTKSYHSEIKAQTYELIGKKDSQIISLKNVIEYSALLGDVSNQEKINQLLLDNSVNQEKAKVKAAKDRNLLLNISLITVLTILLVLMILYINNIKKNKKIANQSVTISKQLTELESLYNYQSTLLSEVHHRIRNNLQLIISLLTLQKAKLSNEIDTNILDILSYRISSISLIHEQLYNLKEFDRIDVKLYAKNLLNNFSALALGKNVAFEYNIENIEFNLETITPVGLIWSELISNSIKCNPDKKDLKIFFSIKKEEEYYEMHYCDNGRGYPQGQFKGNKTGMGFTIINSLSRQLFAEINGYNENGAHFTMRFKEKTISPL